MEHISYYWFYVNDTLNYSLLLENYIFVIGKHIYLEFYWFFPRMAYISHIWLVALSTYRDYVTLVPNKKTAIRHTFLISEVLYLIISYIFPRYNITFSSWGFHKNVIVHQILETKRSQLDDKKLENYFVFLLKM